MAPFGNGSPLYILKLTSYCRRSTVWLGSSVVRVLARYARGPGFESWSGHVLFSSLVTFGGFGVGPCLGCEQQRDCLVGSGMVPSRFGDESN